MWLAFISANRYQSLAPAMGRVLQLPKSLAMGRVLQLPKARHLGKVGRAHSYVGRSSSWIQTKLTPREPVSGGLMTQTTLQLLWKQGITVGCVSGLGSLISCPTGLAKTGRLTSMILQESSSCCRTTSRREKSARQKPEALSRSGCLHCRIQIQRIVRIKLSNSVRFLVHLTSHPRCKLRSHVDTLCITGKGL